MKNGDIIKGGRIAKNTRLELEQKTGKKVITGENFLERKNIKRIS